MELREMQQSFMQDAARLGNYQEMNKTDLANGYCDAEEKGDKRLMSAYLSALMLRYWYKIFEWKRTCASLHLEDGDFVWWLSDVLRVTFEYKAWRDPNNKLYNDPNGPDKVIHQVCFSIRGREYQFYNKAKRRVNVTAYSLDQQVDENGDCALDYIGCTTKGYEVDGSYDVIQMLLKRKEYIEALIIDGIAHHDAFKEDRKVKTLKCVDEETGEEYEDEVKYTDSNFDPRRLVRHLNSITQDFVADFCEKHDVETLDSESIYSDLKKMNNTKLYKMIKKTLLEVKNNPDMMEALSAE